MVTVKNPQDPKTVTAADLARERPYVPGAVAPTTPAPAPSGPGTQTTTTFNKDGSVTVNGVTISHEQYDRTLPSSNKGGMITPDMANLMAQREALNSRKVADIAPVAPVSPEQRRTAAVPER